MNYVDTAKADVLRQLNQDAFKREHGISAEGKPYKVDLTEVIKRGAYIIEKTGLEDVFCLIFRRTEEGPPHYELITKHVKVIEGGCLLEANDSGSVINYGDEYPSLKRFVHDQMVRTGLGVFYPQTPEDTSWGWDTEFGSQGSRSRRSAASQLSRIESILSGRKGF